MCPFDTIFEYVLPGFHDLFRAGHMKKANDSGVLNAEQYLINIEVA